MRTVIIIKKCMEGSEDYVFERFGESDTDTTPQFVSFTCHQPLFRLVSTRPPLPVTLLLQPASSIVLLSGVNLEQRNRQSPLAADYHRTVHQKSATAPERLILTGKRLVT